MMNGGVFSGSTARRAAALSGVAAFLLCGGCGSGGGRPAPSLDSREVAVLSDIAQFNSLIESALPGQGRGRVAAAAGYAAVAETISRSPDVASVTATGGGLTVRFVNGYVYEFIDAAPPTLPAWFTTRLASATRRRRTREAVGTTRAVIIDPFLDDPTLADLPPGHQALVALLQDSGYTVDERNNANGDIDAFRRLAPYGLIFLVTAGHGDDPSATEDADVAFATGERAGETGSALAQTALRYQDDFRAGKMTFARVRYAGPNGNGTGFQTRVAVRSGFFTATYGGDRPLNHSLVYAAASESQRNVAMARAIYRSGGAAFLGWTDEEQNGLAVGFRLLDAMGDGTSLLSAYAALEVDGVTIDPYRGARLTYSPTATAGTLQARGGALPYGTAYYRPSLDISAPRNDETIFDTSVELKGHASVPAGDSVAYLSVSVNGDAPLPLDTRTDGSFSRTLDLTPGDNTITVTLGAYYSGQTEKTIHVQAQEPEPTPTPTPTPEETPTPPDAGEAAPTPTPTPPPADACPDQNSEDCFGTSAARPKRPRRGVTPPPRAGASRRLAPVVKPRSPIPPPK